VQYSAVGVGCGSVDRINTDILCSCESILTKRSCVSLC
jgi:hypothetical protein